MKLKMILNSISVIFIFLRICLSYDSCRDIITKNRQSLSGVYNVSNQHGASLEVYCVFNGSQGYTFISRDTATDFNITTLYTNTSFALLRHLNVNGIQKEVRVEQLSTYKDKAELGFFYNSNPGYNTPQNANNGQFKYIYLGFLPITLAKQKTEQGYRAGGVDFSFSNCDANPNSYIAFYLNVNTGFLFQNIGQLDPFMKGWMDKSIDIGQLQYMDKRFYCLMEMHMGGCGGLCTTQGMGNIRAALGLPFDIPANPCKHNTCLHNGSCVETGDGFECLCTEGYSGSRCQERIACTCPCSLVGSKWSFLSQLNLTRDEIKDIMKDDLKQLEDAIKVKSNTTMSYYLRKNSAKDTRTSAASVGFVGIVILCIPFAILICLDMSYFCKCKDNKQA